MENDIPFEVKWIRQVIKDIEEKKANNMSIELLNTVQHLLLYKKANPLVVADICRYERLRNLPNTCCRRMRYWWF